MKIRDRNQATNAIPAGTSAVDRIFGGAGVIGRDIIETTTTQSGKTIYEVPLDLIKARPVNNYAITGIDELAESIRRTGLWQPIILRKADRADDGKNFVIVAGERRYTAVKYLRDQARKEGNHGSEKVYSSILAIILSPEDEAKEEDIYRDTNDYSRQLTNFERIMRLDPNAIDMTKESWQKRYVEKCLGEDKLADYESGKIRLKGNLVEKCHYIVALLTEKEPDLDITDSTVRVYLGLLERCGETLRQAVLKGVVPLRDARGSLSWLSPDDQIRAVDAAGTDAYEEFLKEGKALSGTAIREQRTDTKEAEGLITAAGRISKKLYSVKKSYDKIYADATYRRDLSEDQSAYIKALREAMQAIERLEKAEAEIGKQ